jgi:L-rhamnose mutarotase
LQKNIKHISGKGNIINNRHTEEWNLITNIKNKMAMNNFTIRIAGEEKTLVILTQEEHFIHDNQFTTINSNQTQHYQKDYKRLQQCNNTAQKNENTRI